jgi:hypothetical protein
MLGLQQSGVSPFSSSLMMTAAASDLDMMVEQAEMRAC